ncbi:hypothetical protein MTP02_19220 [Streptomyces albus]|nr:hypothetical protein MTP02_19220 [Streptomyces albus]
MRGDAVYRAVTARRSLRSGPPPGQAGQRPAEEPGKFTYQEEKQGAEHCCRKACGGEGVTPG